MSDRLNCAAMTSPTEQLVALYDDTVDDVYRYAARLTGGDRARTDDLVQETYLGVLRRLQAGDQLELSAGYLVVACRSRFLDQLKSERRRAEREVRVATTQVPTADHTPIDPIATEALGELPDDQRAALVLRYVDDQPVAEVARLLGRSVSATESLLSRAKRALRTAISHTEDRS